MAREEEYVARGLKLAKIENLEAVKIKKEDNVIKDNLDNLKEVF